MPRQRGWPWLFANHPIPGFPSLLLSCQGEMRAICLWLGVAQALLWVPLVQGHIHRQPKGNWQRFDD